MTSVNVEDVGETLGRMAIAQLGRRAGRAAFKSLGELLSNATTHGCSDVGAFTAAQLYTGASTRTPGFEFAVCDAGPGILDHLRASVNHQDLDDGPTAVERALEYGVGGGPQGRGHGLTNLGQHAIRDGNGGEFMIRSGRAIATVKLRKERTTTTSGVATKVVGTWAWLRVRVL